MNNLPFSSLIFFIYIFLILFIFERERQTNRDRGWAGEGQRERESEASSRLWTVSTEPDAGLELRNREIMTWAKVGHLTNWATQVPRKLRFNNSNEKQIKQTKCCTFQFLGLEAIRETIGLSGFQLCLSLTFPLRFSQVYPGNTAWGMCCSHFLKCFCLLTYNIFSFKKLEVMKNYQILQNVMFLPYLLFPTALFP